MNTHHLQRSLPFAGTAIAVLSALLLAACGPVSTERIVIRGSNTIGEELAPKLVAAFTAQHPQIAFDLEFKGTTYGIGTLVAGMADIAATSRPVSTNEIELARQRDIEFNDYVIGAYSVVVVVHADNPVTNLTRAQVRDLFTGVLTNWQAVGGPDAPVHLHIRAPVSGTYLGFQEIAMDNKPYASGFRTYYRYAEIAQAVARDANGIGYVSLEEGRQPGIRPLAIEGVLPTVEAVNQGRYPYARTLRFYTNKNREKPAALAFIRYVQSPEGQAVLTKLGFAPHP